MSLVGFYFPTVGGAPNHSIQQPALRTFYHFSSIGGGGNRSIRSTSASGIGHWSIRGTSVRLVTNLERGCSDALGPYFEPFLQGPLKPLDPVSGSNGREVIAMKERAQIPVFEVL